MYNFHSDFIKNKCDAKAGLLFPHTDNLMYEIGSENIYENFTKTQKYPTSVINQKNQIIMIG